MYLRITRGRFDPARYDELLPLTREVDAAVQAMPGCQSVHSAVDRTSGRIAVVSRWDTLEQASFSRDTDAKTADVVSRILALGTQLDPPEIYEVVS